MNSYMLRSIYTPIYIYICIYLIESLAAAELTKKIAEDALFIALVPEVHYMCIYIKSTCV
jgi:hypothetical protein